MRITRITEENHAFFEPLLPDLSPGMRALGCIGEDDLAVGAAVFSQEDQTVSLDWIYMDPEYRRQGGASLMIKEAARCLGTHFEALEASFTSEEEGLSDFLWKAGFFVSTGDPVLTLSSDEAKKRNWYQKAQHFSTSNLKPLSSLLLKERSMLSSYILEQTGLSLPLRQKDMGKSLVCFDGKGEVSSCLLVRELDNNRLIAELLLNTGGVTNDLILFRELVKELSEDTEICFLAVNPEVERLIKELSDEPGESSPLVQTSHILYAVRPLSAAYSSPHPADLAPDLRSL